MGGNSVVSGRMLRPGGAPAPGPARLARPRPFRASAAKSGCAGRRTGL